jgi:hypothetical protein
MKKLKSSIIIQIVMLTIFGNLIAQEQKPKSAIVKNVPVIELSGNGYNRGLQHGKILKIEIDQVFKKWKIDLANSTKQNADTLISDFYRSTNFAPAIKK